MALAPTSALNEVEMRSIQMGEASGKETAFILTYLHSNTKTPGCHDIPSFLADESAGSLTKVDVGKVP